MSFEIARSIFRSEPVVAPSPLELGIATGDVRKVLTQCQTLGLSEEETAVAVIRCKNEPDILRARATGDYVKARALTQITDSLIRIAQTQLEEGSNAWVLHQSRLRNMFL